MYDVGYNGELFGGRECAQVKAGDRKGTKREGNFWTIYLSKNRKTEQNFERE